MRYYCLLQKEKKKRRSELVVVLLSLLRQRYLIHIWAKDQNFEEEEEERQWLFVFHRSIPIFWIVPFPIPTFLGSLSRFWAEARRWGSLTIWSRGNLVFSTSYPLVWAWRWLCRRVLLNTLFLLWYLFMEATMLLGAGLNTGFLSFLLLASIVMPLAC